MTPKVERILRRLKHGLPVKSDPVTLVHTRIEGRPVTFCTAIENDPIQRKHRKGGFYEPKELGQMAAHFPKGGTFLDIGANVGNHGLYAALFMEAGRVIPVEPNPRAYKLLIQNALVNGVLDRFDLTRLGVGLGETEAGDYAIAVGERNLGGARLAAGRGGLAVHRGDALFAEETPDLIKIDVEGMEMGVLRGLENLIARARPVILIEVDEENTPDFRAWLEGHPYRIAETVKRHRNNENHLLLPEQ